MSFVFDALHPMSDEMSVALSVYEGLHQDGTIQELKHWLKDNYGNQLLSEFRETMVLSSPDGGAEFHQ